MSRAIDGVAVDASHASAQFDVNDQTVYEAFYWPEIPADVVSTAVALHSKLSDPAQLAAGRRQGDHPPLLFTRAEGGHPPS